MKRFLRNAAAVLAGFLACLPGLSVSKPPAPPAVTGDWCKRLVPRLPGVSLDECRRSQLKLSGAVSRRGFPILVRSLPAAGAARHDKTARESTRVLLLGGIHGDELTSSAIVFEWMQQMDLQQAREFDWHIAPVVNPDGLLAKKPQRMNASGVDLNRNFPTPGWEYDARAYWRQTMRGDPRRFPGAAPLSEPESRWLHDEIERFKPHVIVSVHAPFGVLDFDGPKSPPHQFGRLYFNRVGVYPGSLGNYGGLYKNIPVITIELPNALAMPRKDEVQRIWQDMLIWIGRNISPQPGEAAVIRQVSSSSEADNH